MGRVLGFRASSRAVQDLNELPIKKRPAEQKCYPFLPASPGTRLISGVKGGTGKPMLQRAGQRDSSQLLLGSAAGREEGDGWMGGGCSVQHPHWDSSTQPTSRACHAASGHTLKSHMVRPGRLHRTHTVGLLSGSFITARGSKTSVGSQLGESWRHPVEVFLPVSARRWGCFPGAGAESDIAQPASPPGGERVKVLDMELRQVMPLPRGGNVGQLILPQ